MKNKLERKTETISESENHITFNHYVRKAGESEWDYIGTITHTSDGDSSFDFEPE